MATIADFLPLVLPYATGCPSPLALQHIRDICIDFCTHAAVVQVDIDPIDTVAGQIEYDIDTPTGQETTLILEAAYLGNPLSIFKNGDAALSNAIRQTPGNTFVFGLAPQESTPQAITLRVATRPTRTANVVADVLLNDYSHAISMGVVGRLMLIPGHAFSNPGSAVAYSSIYTTARTDARIRADRSFGSADMRVRPRRFQ